jgi:hypothetical protein
VELFWLRMGDPSNSCACEKNAVFWRVLKMLKKVRLEVRLDCKDELFNAESILVKGMFI